MHELSSKVRKVAEADNGLTRYSYSKLDLFGQCSYKYNLKYNQKKYPVQNAIHLDVGTLCHKLLELKGSMLMEETSVDYELLHDVLQNGIVEETDKGSEEILGLIAIKKKYGFEKWFEKDNASGMTYDEKLKIFMEDIMPNEMESEEWKVYATELSFEFVYEYENGKKALIGGFIDRVDINADGEFRVVDYKTSKKVFDTKKMATPMQMCIYGMALYSILGQVPIEYQYSFILINQKQDACTTGHMKRAVKKLDKTLSSIDNLDATNVHKPSPTPLCYWCEFCKQNPDANTQYQFECEYYSMWTPSEKTFKVAKEFVKEDENKNTVKRKLVF